MSTWECNIDGCGRRFQTLESVLTHQVSQHERHECKVCGSVVPEGFFAIEHAFEEHTRAEYVRAYDADADAIRHRESVKEAIEAEIDVAEFRRQLEGGSA